MTQNLVFRHLSAEQWTQLDAAIATVVGILEPALVPLAPAQKRAAVKMGDGSEAFCRAALQVFEENLALLPRSFDIEEMRRDLESHDALNARIVKLTQLLEKARDTEIALGSDVMAASLEGYAVIKAVGKAEGVQALRRLLGRRFDGGSREAEPRQPAAAQ